MSLADMGEILACPISFFEERQSLNPRPTRRQALAALAVGPVCFMARHSFGGAQSPRPNRCDTGFLASFYRRFHANAQRAVRDGDMKWLKVYQRLVAEYETWNATMLPENPKSYSEKIIGKQWADHYGNEPD